MPSVKILLEYIDPRLAAKRQRRDTASGINITSTEAILETFNFFRKYSSNANTETAIKML